MFGAGTRLATTLLQSGKIVKQVTMYGVVVSMQDSDRAQALKLLMDFSQGAVVPTAKTVMMVVVGYYRTTIAIFSAALHSVVHHSSLCQPYVASDSKQGNQIAQISVILNSNYTLIQ